MSFERITTITGAYDKRNADPKKNYGIHGMEMRFVLKGERGAVQFVYYSCQYLKHVADELALSMIEKGSIKYHAFRGMAVDIGYHAYTPQFEGQSSRQCEILGCDCYYDGSSLNAEEFEDKFLRGGSDVVWPMLEEYYADIFDAE